MLQGILSGSLEVPKQRKKDRILLEGSKKEARRKQVVLKQCALQGLLRGSLPVVVSDAASRAES